MSITALEIANSIAMKVIAMNAVADGNHPILSEIYSEMTGEQRRLCAKENWTFLNDNVTVNSYSVSTTSATQEAGVITLTPALVLTQASASKTEYFAEKITTSSDKLAQAYKAELTMKLGQIGIGAPSGTWTAMICPDVNGSPDVDNAVFTSTAVTATYTDSLVLNEFTLVDSGTVLTKNTIYWIVFKWIGAADNGDGIYVAHDQTTASTTTKHRLNNATTWTAYTTGRLITKLYYYEADYLTSLTLPANIVDVYAIYSGDNQVKADNMLPYAGDQYINSGLDLPMCTFTVREASPLVLYIHPSTWPLTWQVECKVNPTTITADTDTSIIPDDSIDWLINQCAGNFVDRGYGTTGQNAQTFWFQASEDKILMEFKYLPKPSQGFNVVRSGRIRGTQYTESFNRRVYGR